MTIIGGILLMISTVVMLIASAGILRLPNALARQHAATKAATLSVSLFILGLLLQVIDYGWGWEWLFRLGALVVVLLITLPLAAHALGRSAIIEETTVKGKSSSTGLEKYDY
jgi:multicomponent Na+:H+ antiporter subunit G